MKATDLMIGDWVRVIRTVRPKECMARVIDIGEDGIWVMENEGGEWFIHRNESFPIPLTPEILEKNGFRWTGSGDRTMMCGTPYDFEGIRYNLYVGLGKKYIEVHAAMTEKKDERWRKVNKTYLEVCGCYVHELQHALKLCGIEKEITL